MLTAYTLYGAIALGFMLAIIVLIGQAIVEHKLTARRQLAVRKANLLGC